MGFTQVKHELGWADFRLTDYASIERWWEIVFSAYLLVSFQANNCSSSVINQAESSSSSPNPIEKFSQHPWWESGTNWKSALNNLRLIIQPYIFWCLIQPWLKVFPIPGMKRGFFKLIELMNSFPASSPEQHAIAS